jgi:hypothetical protein
MRLKARDKISQLTIAKRRCIIDECDLISMVA